MIITIYFRVAVFITKAPTALYVSQYALLTHSHPCSRWQIVNSIKPSNGWMETLAHDTGTGSWAHGKQHGSFNFHMSPGFLRAQLKDPCSINCLVVKHSYHRRTKNLLCSANMKTLWFQDVCSNVRFRTLKLSPLAVTKLNCNRQLKGWIIKQWHCNLTLFHDRKIPVQEKASIFILQAHHTTANWCKTEKTL